MKSVLVGSELGRRASPVPQPECPCTTAQRGQPASPAWQRPRGALILPLTPHQPVCCEVRAPTAVSGPKAAAGRLEKSVWPCGPRTPQPRGLAPDACEVGSPKTSLHMCEL